MSELESYSAPGSLSRQLLDDVTLPELPEVSKTLRGKLRFFAKETPDSASPLEAEATVRHIFAAEGRGPEDCARLLEALRDYEVVSPNMFLTESLVNGKTTTSFHPHGTASARLEKIAGRIVQAIQESGEAKYDPEITGLNHEAMTAYVYDYLQVSLAGPFAAILDLGSEKPILVLNDASYTSPQLFRAFSGVYCDFTPFFGLSKSDLLEFSVHHEIGHKISEEIAAQGVSNQYLPGVDLGIDPGAISHANLLESIADAYAALKHLQRSGSAKFLEQMAVMRTLEVFSHSFKQFETDFTLKFGCNPRKRSGVEHFTAPTLDPLIPRAIKLHQAGTLQKFSDKELMAVAIETAREMKMSAEGLTELSCFATALTFNALRQNFQGAQIPERKNSISPSVVELVLDAVEHTGSFEPRGGNSLERGVLSMGKDGAQRVSPELKSVFARYRQANEYLRTNGIAPFTKEAGDYLLADLLSTLNLPANRTPNMTIARELNDSWAGEYKYVPSFAGHYNLVGARKMLEHCGVDEADAWDSFDRAREYRKKTGDSPRTGDMVLALFGENPAA